jgi:hypothetical protein
MGFSEEQLRACLPEACGARAIDWHADGLELALDGGRVALRWQVLAPRRIALIALPRIAVRFEARGVAHCAWQRFMRHFDLVAQRGGG